MQNTRTLTDVLGQYRFFEVPPYQRPYAWAQREVLDLLGDIRDIPAGQEHFTGTLVLHEIRSDTAHLVDGQQRLTTIVVLLDRVARRLRALGHADKAAEIEARLRLRDHQSALKLYGALDRDLRRRVLTDAPLVGLPETAGGRRLVAARDQIDAALLDKAILPGADEVEALTVLADKIFSRLQFAVVTVSDASEVGLIFETMNNRGRPLSELEKVKNYLLFVSSRVQHDDEYLDDAINETWTYLFQVLAAHGLVRRGAEEQFLRAHWLATVDPSVQRWQGYASVRERYSTSGRSDFAELAGEVRLYLASMESLVAAYAEAVDPDDRSFEDLAKPDHVRRISRKLYRLGATATFLPLLIATRQRVPERYSELVQWCELYAYRVYRIAGWQTRSAQGAFAYWASRLWSAADPAAVYEDTVSNMKADLVGRCPFDRMRSHLEDRTLDWYRNLTKIRHLLFEYEEELCGNHPFPFDWDRDEPGYAARTIEHILPQYVEKGYDSFSEEQRKELRHDLGNLSLTRDNSAMSNLPFESKQLHYRRGLEQERELGGLDDWTPEELESRRSRLVDFALRRWRLPDEETVAEADVEPEELDPSQGIDGPMGDG